MRRPLLPLLLVGILTGCGVAAIDQAAKLPTPSTPAPRPDAMRAELWRLAQAAPLPSDEPFTWLWWEGDATGQALDSWPELSDFRADFPGQQLRGAGWDAFERALKAAYPDSLTVYKLAAHPCPGDCEETSYIIEGRGPAGVSGFIGSVQNDH